MTFIPFGGIEMNTSSLFNILRKGPLKVTILGAGNWGSAVSILAAENCAESYLFHERVTLWVREETMPDGRLFSQEMNETHENSRYMPGVKLPENVFAEPSLEDAVREADLILFVLPHQFVVTIAELIKGKIKTTARCISLAKGLHVVDGVPQCFSAVLQDILDVECLALSGANVAKDIARKQFSEATIGYFPVAIEMASIWQQLFDRPYFRVRALPDVAGVQVCGALKNVLALAAGFCDGMGMGTNTKSALIRMGMAEMRLFAALFFDGILEESFFDSCGMADVVTTCFGGRNVRCAAEFVRRGGKSSWEEIEKDLLGGMKMQGQLTCDEVHQVLARNELQHLFPLFEATYNIAFQGYAAETLFHRFSDTPDSSTIQGIDTCTKVALQPDLKALAKDIKFSLKLARKDGSPRSGTPRSGSPRAVRD